MTIRRGPVCKAIPHICLLYVWLLYVPAAFSPGSVFLHSALLLHQTTVTCLYVLHWMVYVVEANCVFCEVQTELLYTFVYFSLQIVRNTIERNFCTYEFNLDPLKPSGHYMYRTVVTIYTVQWSLYVPHSGHYMYRTVVTICTSSLTLTTLRSAHTSVFMCFMWIWEQTAIISLYNINWLVCVTEV